VKTQPFSVSGSHVSVVQGLPSVHARSSPPQTPPSQASLMVQGLSSSHPAVLFSNSHAPVARSQRTVVHGFASSVHCASLRQHCGSAGPGTSHVPSVPQLSGVQGLSSEQSPSSSQAVPHGGPTSTFAQQNACSPPNASHVSIVHLSSSSQAASSASPAHAVQGAVSCVHRPT